MVGHASCCFRHCRSPRLGSRSARCIFLSAAVVRPFFASSDGRLCFSNFNPTCKYLHPLCARHIFRTPGSDERLFILFLFIGCEYLHANATRSQGIRTSGEVKARATPWPHLSFGSRILCGGHVIAPSLVSPVLSFDPRSFTLGLHTSTTIARMGLGHDWFVGCASHPPQLLRLFPTKDRCWRPWDGHLCLLSDLLAVPAFLTHGVSGPEVEWCSFVPPPTVPAFFGTGCHSHNCI